MSERMTSNIPQYSDIELFTDVNRIQAIPSEGTFDDIDLLMRMAEDVIRRSPRTPKFVRDLACHIEFERFDNFAYIYALNIFT